MRCDARPLLIRDRVVGCCSRSRRFDFKRQRGVLGRATRLLQLRSGNQAAATQDRMPR